MRAKAFFNLSIFSRQLNSFENMRNQLIFVFIVVILTLIVFTNASPPRMKINFGVNLPSMSFRLPGFNMPKIQITATIKKAPPRKPMKITLPSINLKAQSLDDSWDDGGYGGWSNSVSSGWNDQQAYGSENHESGSDYESEEVDDENEQNSAVNERHQPTPATLTFSPAPNPQIPVNQQYPVFQPTPVTPSSSRIQSFSQNGAFDQFSQSGFQFNQNPVTGYRPGGLKLGEYARDFPGFQN